MKRLIAAINARRIETHYQAALADAALADAWRRHYLAGLAIEAGGRALDYGCGRGRVSAMLRQQCFRVVGLDVQAHSWWHDVEGASFVVASPEPRHAPFADATFDLVLNIDSTHYYDADRLRHHAHVIHRLLRAGGHWVIVQGNPDSYGGSLAWVKPPGRLHSLDDARLASMSAGFIEVDHWFEGVTVPVSPVLYMRLRQAVRPWPLYMNDHGSWIERLVPARKRHRWVLRVQKRVL